MTDFALKPMDSKTFSGTPGTRPAWRVSLLIGLLMTLLVPSVVLAARPKANVTLNLNVTALQPGEPAAIAVVTDIPAGLHSQSASPLEDNYIAYRVSLVNTPHLTAGPVQYPAGTIETFPGLGKLSVYNGRVISYIPIVVAGDVPAGKLPIQVKVTYQLCDDQACYFKETPTITLEATVVRPGETIAPANADLFKGFDAAALDQLPKPQVTPVLGTPISSDPHPANTTQPVTTQPASTLPANTQPTTQPAVSPPNADSTPPEAQSQAPSPSPASPANAGDRVISGSTGTDAASTFTLFGWALGTNSYLLAYVGAIIVGLLFNVMPCVLPVLPLKAMGFYETAQHHRARSLGFGAVFGLGVITSFGALALPIVVFKTFTWGEQFSNPWFSGAIVLILLVMGLSLFGSASINLPTFIYNFSPRHDTYTGNFLFGILTAILSTPCTFAMLTGLLAWAIQQPTGIGVSLLMTVGLGMALPYVILAAFPEVARRFPRTGPWSHLFKQMMGFLLIGSALFFAPSFLHRLIPNHVHTWLMFGLVAIAAIFLVARACGLSRNLLPRVISIALALGMIAVGLWAAILLTSRHWEPLTRQSLNASLATCRPVLVEFTADWCTNCKVLELTVFADKNVSRFLQQQNVIVLRGDLTADDAPGWEIINEISDIGSIPLTAIYLPNTDVAKPIQLAGIFSVEDLRNALTTPTASVNLTQP